MLSSASIKFPTKFPTKSRAGARESQENVQAPGADEASALENSACREVLWCRAFSRITDVSEPDGPPCPGRLGQVAWPTLRREIRQQSKSCRLDALHGPAQRFARQHLGFRRIRRQCRANRSYKHGVGSASAGQDNRLGQRSQMKPVIERH